MQSKKDISILMIDNLEDGLVQLERLLKRRYRDVDLCESYDKAKNLCAQKSYNIIIVALDMYDGEGYKVVNHIAKHNPDQRIITYSAEPEHPSHAQGCDVCLKQNKRHRIIKPVITRNLYREIEEYDTLTCAYAKIAKERYEGYLADKA